MIGKKDKNHIYIHKRGVCSKHSIVVVIMFLEVRLWSCVLAYSPLAINNPSQFQPLKHEDCSPRVPNTMLVLTGQRQYPFQPCLPQQHKQSVVYLSLTFALVKSLKLKKQFVVLDLHSFALVWTASQVAKWGGLKSLAREKIHGQQVGERPLRDCIKYLYGWGSFGNFNAA